MNLHFDGTDRELFIKRVEKVAKIQKDGGRDIALQLPFMVKNNKILEVVERMEGHETGNWTLLKKELLRKWGRATPLKRYGEESIPKLIKKAQDEGGINTKEAYKKFVDEYEEMIAYFVKNEYNSINPDSGDPLWKALSAEMRKEVAKELAHHKILKTTKDGRKLVPILDILKVYVKIVLDVIDFGEEANKAEKNEKVEKGQKEYNHSRACREDQPIRKENRKINC